MKSPALVVAIFLLIGLSSCGQHHGGHGHGHGNGSHGIHDPSIDEDLKSLESGPASNFSTVGLRKVHKKAVPFPASQVFPLFEPAGRPLLYEWWAPTIVNEGENGSLKGHVEMAEHDGLKIFLTVTEYEPSDGHIQYLVIWGDFEIQRIDVYCERGEDDSSTEITWVEHNAGLYEKGVSLVSMFVQEGYLVKAVDRYIGNLEKELAELK